VASSKYTLLYVLLLCYMYWLVVSPLCNYEINATSHTAVRYRVLMKNELKFVIFEWWLSV